jgi:hypothetical protein
MKAYFVLVSIGGVSHKYYVHASNSADAITKTLIELTSELGDDMEIICKLTVPVRE